LHLSLRAGTNKKNIVIDLRNGYMRTLQQAANMNSAGVSYLPLHHVYRLNNRRRLGNRVSLFQVSNPAAP
jgi:hypothetical protein